MIFLLAVLLSCGVLRAGVEFNAATQVWTLQSGGVEYRLRQRGAGVTFEYFGMAGKDAWAVASGWRGPLLRHDIAGTVDGRHFLPEDLTLASHEIRRPAADRGELRLVYRHKRLPLEIEALYATWGDTGVLTRELKFTNRGSGAMHLASAPSLAWRMPPGEYDLDYLYGVWSQERRLASERLREGRRAFVNPRGRSSAGYSPWFCLRNEQSGVRFAAQLAWSGNWEMLFERFLDRNPKSWQEQDLRVELGIRFDMGGPALLEAGASLSLPAVAFTASTGDLDDVANQLHRYQRRYVVPRATANKPLLTQYNSWYPFRENVTAANLKQAADVAAELGLEAFVIDSGWYRKTPDERSLFGDWESNAATFPNGIKEVSDYVRGKGMKFGVWLEIEVASTDSQTFREHPDWYMAYNGQPVAGARTRVHLDFAKPEVRRWARAVLDRLVKRDGIEWVKLDYNIDAGEQLDAGGRITGTVLYNHIVHYYQWLDELRAAYPQLVIENCSSGGLRIDLGMLARTDTSWLSDNVRPRPSAQLAWGCTLEFLPEICNHWMVGDDNTGIIKPGGSPEWWDFLFRVPMNGQFGISSRVLDWSPELKQSAIRNVALYKRLREVIMGADVYHLTPQPIHEDPIGWMAIQYCTPGGKRSAVTVYRFAQSERTRTFRLRGLDAARTYTVTRDGAPLGTFRGSELESKGLALELAAEWQAAVIELSSL